MSAQLSSFARSLSVETAFTVLALARSLKAAGKDVVELEIGDSPFDSTAAARAGGMDAIKNNQSHYCPSPGIPEFRQAAADFVREEFGIPAEASNIVAGPGAKVFEQFFCEVFLNPGDGVLVFSPYFPTYLPNIERRGARAVLTPLHQANGFRPTVADIERFLADDPSPRAVFLNSPHNPTGGVTTAEDVKRIADVVRGRDVAGSFIVAIPVAIAQFVLGAAFEAVLGRQTDVSIVSSTLAAALAGAPFAYVLSGIVLGDVDPFEAARRSFRVFRARKVAAALVAVFETAATLLVLVGLLAGLDIAVRMFGALGLGTNSGPAGLTLMTLGILAGVFALGTLIYTAYAIAVAPQIVMFVGLTRATFGLDHVRPGGDRDPAMVSPGRRRFRWLTIPLLIAFGSGIVGLGAFVVILSS